MSKLPKISVQGLLDGQFVVQNYNFFETTKKAEWLPPTKEVGVPRVRLSWYEREYFSTANAEQVLLLVEKYGAGKDSVELYRGKASMWAVRAKDGVPIQRHWTICNFGRSGWFGSADPEGTAGYWTGQDWTLGYHGGLTCCEPEQVMRDSLIRFLAASVAGGRCSIDMIYSPQVRLLLDRLLQDALDPENRGASYSEVPFAMHPILQDKHCDLTNKKLYPITVIE